MDYSRPLRMWHEGKMRKGQNYYFTLQNGELVPRSEQRRWLEMHTAEIERLLGLYPGDRFLDIGCGEGYFTFKLAGRTEKSLGVDISVNALAAARTRLDYDSTKLHLTVAPGDQLPLTDSRFNKLLCHHVLEHVQDDAACVREMYRVLEMGGIAVVGVPQVFSWQMVWLSRIRRSVFRGSKLLTVEKTKPGALVHDFIGRKSHIRFYSLVSLCKLMEAHGFRVLERVGICIHTPGSLKMTFRKSLLLFRLGTLLTKRIPQLASDILVKAVKV